MKTITRTVVVCGEIKKPQPLALTNMVGNGNPIYISWVRASRYQGEKVGYLEVYFLEETNPFLGESLKYYNSAVREGPDVVTEQISNFATELGLIPCGRNKTLTFRFKIVRQTFCHQASEIMLLLNNHLGIASSRWLADTIVFQDSIHKHKGSWYPYSEYLLDTCGIVRI